MAAKHRVIVNTMNISCHGATARRTNVEAHGDSRPQRVLEKLNGAADSDSSIEIFEGNLFAEKALKSTKDIVKKSKPIHPFFLEQRRSEVPLTSARLKSDSKKASKHDENLRTERVTLRANNVLQRSRNHTDTAGKEVSRRGISQKEAGGDIDKVEGSSAKAPEDCKGRGALDKKSKSKADAEANSLMPAYSFADYCDTSPAIIYTRCEDEANRLVQNLESPLGFDLEWRVLWHSGAQERRTALVQLCDKTTVLLIQEVIESPSIIKTGANILNDGEKLYRDFGIIARGLVELGALAHFTDDAFSSIYKRRVVSLAKMTAMYLKRHLVKSKERTSNWEGNLNNKMVDYAANDTHAALMVHLKLLDSAKVGNKDIDPTKYTSSVNPHNVGGDKVTVPHVLPVSNAPNFPPEPPRPQYMRAYNLWYHRNMPLDRICNTLKTGGRVEPLKESTVISYVVGAIQADTSLPFDMGKLLDLVRMEAASWQRHRAWLIDAERSGRGHAVPGPDRIVVGSLELQ
ncbi:hypothetical protein AZE42_00655 [Rhizopogon vesiculosus]|uniref:3'-5' exonuclease n=1 Tax=Rhizopogon vesiculosus TaxID=180088 RepID=A0A1J8QSV9_9AGAM|nr:hypothetical protein AZE42_00655 [Rhizopogon vesiculosus]